MVEENTENYGSGWISLYRSIKDHWIFDNDKYFKWWVIMLFEVNHSEKEIMRYYEVYKISKGESCNSLRTWANLFKCSTKTVNKFFTVLEKNKMINRKKIGKGKQALTLINITNYNDYQSKKKQGLLQGVNTKETKGKQGLPTNNKDNNYNNVNNKKNRVFNFRKELTVLGAKDELIDDWLKVRKNKKATNTETAFKTLKKQFELNGNDINVILETCIVKSWAGFKSEWMQTQNNEKFTHKRFSL